MLIPSCTDYQDEIDSLDIRVTRLENLVKTINSQIEALEVIVDALKDADYIDGVRETADGYVINFKKHGPLEIKDGIDGKDAQSPDITIEEDPSTGDWYWKLNGVWLTGDDGKRVRANGKDGKDGKDGEDGEDGKDAISPTVRINPATLVWEISVDGGETWASTGTPAVGADGKDGKDGRDGIDGNSFIKEVRYSAIAGEGAFMVIEVKGGSTFYIPIYNAD